MLRTWTSSCLRAVSYHKNVIAVCNILVAAGQYYIIIIMYLSQAFCDMLKV